MALRRGPAALDARDRDVLDALTGLFKGMGPLAPRPSDPDLYLWAGTLAPAGGRHVDVAVGGAGWTEAGATLAGLGEGIERHQPCPLPGEEGLEASLAEWPLEEPALGPEAWVLFHPEQYARDGFPFRPFAPETRLRWTCFRDLEGEPRWIPAELGFLYLRAGRDHVLAPGISTGLAAGRLEDPVALRGAQEVVERDGLMGAWWGSYPLERWPVERALAEAPPAALERLLRPHLEVSCYRVESPYSRNLCVVTYQGPEREGLVFSAGAACRETLGAAFLKAAVEAVQGRSYVRWLLTRGVPPEPGRPRDFSEHAVFFSRFPDALARTPFARARPAPARDPAGEAPETLSVLRARLEPEHPILVRSMTPTELARDRRWRVLRVVIPGLQPMHGNHELPLLGGPLWRPRGWGEWSGVLPHPFP
ncbi:MAG: YcaO-like family protein [Planctomycetota bacterium]